MKAGAFVVTFIALGLIAYEHQPSFFSNEQRTSKNRFPSEIELQAQLLKYPKFATVGAAKSSVSFIEVHLPVDSLFYKNSTSFSPESSKQFAELVSYLNSLDKSSTFEVSLLGYVDGDFNPKFRSKRLRKLTEAIQKTGITEQRIENVRQVIVDDPTSREIASQAGPSASPDLAKNQYITLRIRSTN